MASARPESHDGGTPDAVTPTDVVREAVRDMRRRGPRPGHDAPVRQSEMAAALGMSRQSFADIENGPRGISVEELVSLASLLGVSPISLLGSARFHQVAVRAVP